MCYMCCLHPVPCVQSQIANKIATNYASLCDAEHGLRSSRKHKAARKELRSVPKSSYLKSTRILRLKLLQRVAKQHEGVKLVYGGVCIFLICPFIRVLTRLLLSLPLLLRHGGVPFAPVSCLCQ